MLSEDQSRYADTEGQDMTEREKRIASVAGRLRAARFERGWTQDQLADVSGVGVATIRRIENRTTEPRIDTTARLADALGVGLKALAFGDDDEGGSK